MKVVLFDIDGTLLSTRGVGRRAMEAALGEHFGTIGPDTYRYDGKTDRQIARDLMRSSGFGDEDIDSRMARLLARYLDGLRDELLAAPHALHVHVGVRELLEDLCQRADVMVGLLTGNIEGGAHLKLSAAGLQTELFRVGAFGSDSELRDDLPAIARDRAIALTQTQIPGEAFVIIGDTPHDVTCGRGICARAIAVATGSYSSASLASHSPAAVFDDLSDTARVVAAILDA